MREREADHIQYERERNAALGAEIQEINDETAKILEKVEAKWRPVIALKQRTLLDPALKNTDLGERVLKKYQYIDDSSRNESNVRHRLACKLMKEYEDWVVEHEKEVVAAE